MDHKKEKPVSIYRLCFPNGKAYVGQSHAMRARMSKHRENARNRDLPLYKAWRKYGEPALEILEVVPPADANETERKYISSLGTALPNGYNVALGGTMRGYKLTPEQYERYLARHRNNPVSEETRAKMRAAKLGVRRTFSEEHRKNISLAQKGSKRGTLPEATRKKMSEARRLWHANHSKQVTT